MGTLNKDALRAICYGFMIVFNKPVFRRLCPDSLYIKFQYRFNFGKKLDLSNPKTINEKTQWYKLNYRDSEFPKMVDKYDVRRIVEKKIGKEHLIPIIVDSKIKSFDDIDFDKLPQSFVIKCTHDSHSAIVVKDKNQIDLVEVRNKINKCLKKNHFWYGREWAYKNVEPNIIIEELITNDDSSELKNYKFFCFDGTPKYIQVEYGIFDSHIINSYSMDWEYIPVSSGVKTNPSENISRPKNFDTMVKIAKELSAGIPFVRVDLYDTGSKVYFGELTFYDGSGYDRYDPDEYDLKFGEMFILPNKKSD